MPHDNKNSMNRILQEGGLIADIKRIKAWKFDQFLIVFISHLRILPPCYKKRQ